MEAGERKYKKERNGLLRKIYYCAAVATAAILFASILVSIGKYKQTIDSHDYLGEERTRQIEQLEQRVNTCETDIAGIKSKVNDTYELVRSLVERQMGSGSVNRILKKEWKDK